MDIRDPLEDNSLRDFANDNVGWILTIPRGRHKPSLSAFIPEGEQPNAFNRLMQRICFGYKWRKL